MTAASPDLAIGPDGQARCPWGNHSDDYRDYHDDEWGRPVRDENALFERLCLESFQSGLSWITILRKRPAFRQAFEGFSPVRVAAFGEDDVQRLLSDAGIVRHRGKIEATVANARALLGVWDNEGEGWLAGRLAQAAREGRPVPGVRPRRLADVPASTEGSAALARDLRARGFRFLGPVTLYAGLQATGFVDDHLAGCVVPPESPV